MPTFIEIAAQIECGHEMGSNYDHKRLTLSFLTHCADACFDAKAVVLLTTSPQYKSPHWLGGRSPAPRVSRALLSSLGSSRLEHGDCLPPTIDLEPRNKICRVLGFASLHETRVSRAGGAMLTTPASTSDTRGTRQAPLSTAGTRRMHAPTLHTGRADPDTVLAWCSKSRCARARCVARLIGRHTQ